MSSKRFLLIVLTVDFVAVVAALFLGEVPESLFREKQPMTWLSFAQLLGCGGLCALVLRALHRQGAGRMELVAWGLATAGFVFLALDEVMRFHEKVDRKIHKTFDLEETGLSDRLDDLIVLVYAIVAVVAGYKFRRELARFRTVLPTLGLAFAGVATMIALDVLTNRPDIVPMLFENRGTGHTVFEWMKGIEDALKILTEGVLLGAGFRCLEIARADPAPQAAGGSGSP